MSVILNRGISNCCGASVWENSDRCQACGENCEVIDDDEEAH